MNNENQDVTNADILEFLQEHMVMKADFDGLNKEVKEVNVKLGSLDSRFAAFQMELEDIKIKLAAIEVKLQEDTDALNNMLITEVTKLKQRVLFLEQKLGLPGLDFNGAVI